MVEKVDQLLLIVQQPTILISLIIILLGFTLLGRRSQRTILKIPVGFFILFLLFSLCSPYVQKLQWPSATRIVDVGALITLFFGIIRIITYIVLDFIIGKRKAITVPAITKDLIIVILYVIVVMIILHQQLNVDVTSLVATSAILTAIIGLALQETLGNLFSGLALNIEKPYKLGDWVTFDKYRGQVKGMSWRSTMIITPENETIAVPNNVISRSHIVNYSDPSTLIVSGFSIGVEYGAPPNHVRDVILESLRTHPEVIADRGLEVRLIDFCDHLIKYEVRYWIDIRDDYEQTDRIKSDIMTQLWYRLRRVNIRIPYPIRIQYQAKEPAKEELTRQIISALQNISLFSSLSASDCHLLATMVSTLEFAEGEVIVRQDDEGACMYVIASGVCEILVHSQVGRDLPIATLPAGDFFGEMSLMTGAKRNATVRARTDLVLYEIAKDDMLKLLKTNPLISTTISESLAKRMADRATAIATDDTQPKLVTHQTAGQILQKIRAFFHLS